MQQLSDTNMSKPKKMGRPPLPKGRSKAKQYGVRLTPEAAAELESAAKRSGKSPAELARERIQQAAEIPVSCRWPQGKLHDQPIRVICEKMKVEFSGRLFARGETSENLWLSMTLFAVGPDGRGIAKSRSLTQADADALTWDGAMFVLRPPQT